MIKTATLLLFLSGISTAVWAQDWTAARTTPAGVPVRVFTPTDRIDGRLALMDDDHIRIVSDGKLVPIARNDIVRLESRRRDPLWNGMLVGALTSLALRAAFGGDACSRTPEPRCTMQGLAVGAGLGTFIDLQITRFRVIYAAPQPTITLLRWTF